MAKDKYGGTSRKRRSLGLVLDKVTSALPAGTYGALFNIVGGRVVVTSMVGEVTTVIQTQGCNLKITSTPTTGTAVDVTTDLAISGDAKGSFYGMGVYVAATVGGAGATGITSTPNVVPVGTLGTTTSATNAGSIQWSVTYVPLDDDAYMEVA